MLSVQGRLCQSKWWTSPTTRLESTAELRPGSLFLPTTQVAEDTQSMKQHTSVRYAVTRTLRALWAHFVSQVQHWCKWRQNCTL
jgi:hypothetical protein